MFSFLIPVYNGEKYIRRCIESILCQKDFDLEIIVYDDGSTDKTIEILNEIKKIDNRVQIYSRPNKGLFLTRKDLLSKVNGDYFWFVDADDTISEDALKMLDEKLSQNNYDVVFIDYNRIDGNNCVVMKQIDQDYIGPTRINSLLMNMVCSNCCNNAWNKIYKTSSIKDIDIQKQGIRKVSMGEDLMWSVFLLAQVKSVGYLDIPLYNYYIIKNSMSRSFSIEKYKDYIIVRNNILKFLISRNIQNRTLNQYYSGIINEMVYRVYYYYSICDLTDNDILKMIRLVKKEYRFLYGNVSISFCNISTINSWILKGIFMNDKYVITRIKLASILLKMRNRFIR